VRISKLWLDGYGRFAGRDLDMAGQLQIIFGPNEQGKSTLRSFIGDMLYGQKRSATQRLYDDAHGIRRPWQDSCYAGRILYRLDNGHEIEVHRNFEKDGESVQVFHLSHSREITGDFPVQRNREVAFAEEHLGLSKTVFLNVATISDLTLDGLGDDRALVEIRERILSLADSADEHGSADSALKSIEERINTIGRPSPTSKRPLPAARQRLAELDSEYAAAVAQREELGESETRRQDLLKRLAGERLRQAQLEQELASFEAVTRARDLEKAEAIAAKIEQITRDSFQLSAYREFPLDQGHEVQRAANAVATAQAQLERTRKEQLDLDVQACEEKERLGPAGHLGMAEVDEDVEQELSEIDARSRRLRDRLEELEADYAAARANLDEAQETLRALPDFSRMAADPVEWLNDLTSSFRVQRQTRDGAREKELRLRQEFGVRRRELAGLEQIFGRFDDFSAEARDFEIHCQVTGQEVSLLRTRKEQLETVANEHRGGIPGFRIMAIFCGFFLAAFVALAALLSHTALYIPAVLFGLGGLFFVFNWFWASHDVRRAQAQIDEAADAIEKLEADARQRQSGIDQAVSEAGYESLRELEALHERYTQAQMETIALEAELGRQEALANEEERRAQGLFEHLRSTFSELTEELTDENGVQTAVGRVISRYHAYRDAKRTAMDRRESENHASAELHKCRENLKAAQAQEIALALEVRRALREAGFSDESRHTTALSALRAYRIRFAKIRQQRGRIDVLEERVEAAAMRHEAEKNDLAGQEEALAKLLGAAGADSVEEWHRRAGKAREYREAWSRRASLQEQLATVLNGRELDDLRRAVDEDGPCRVEAGRTLDEVKGDLAASHDSIDALLKQEHALHLEIAEQTAGLRPINEIEEERAAVAAREEGLALELEAAAYAATVIEEVARDKHARIAPVLAERASRYLDEITAGAYRELLISRDLHINVRIPQTDRLNGDPKRQLSKGTTDQIYLALRLALIQSLSKAGESIPMLLDDPFANYDDMRLANALTLLQRLARDTQVLLFTCREDVARAGRLLGAPVLEL
jgi:uncharacterized protein YhaN